MSDDTKVLYNEDCPVCRFEITHYKTYAGGQDLPIRFEDLNTEDLTQWGLTPDEAAKRLHVLSKGEILSGIPAFLVLWQEMPRYRWLAKIIGFPGIYQLSCGVYDHVLAPALFVWHKRRVAKQRAQRHS